MDRRFGEYRKRRKILAAKDLALWKLGQAVAQQWKSLGYDED